MFSKIAVTGPDTHPLYQALIAAQPKAIGPTRASFRENLNSFLSNDHNGATTNPEPGILWNFEKFLIDRNGNVVARFSPEVTPDDPPSSPPLNPLSVQLNSPSVKSCPSGTQRDQESPASPALPRSSIRNI